MEKYQICTHCIMDTSDPRIQFDDQGVCEYCNNFKTTIAPSWNTGEQGAAALARMAEKIKVDTQGKDFDAIIGLSGGLDSSYAAYVAVKKMGLRPLLFHVDAGWNTDQAVGNIEKLVDGLGVDLYTEVINWEEMKDLQVAFLKAGIPDQDIPQDAAFFSALYQFARKNKIKHVITGSNFSTECCREPEEWGGYPGIDKTLIGDIHGQFGKRSLRTFPLKDSLVSKVFYESRFTRFYEDYWMPRKFGYHKRRAHFSSLIMTGQMTRDAALERISRPEMDEHFLKQEFEYVAHKLDLTVPELQAIFDAPNRTFHDYKNKRWLIGLGAKVLSALGLEKRLFR
jgi:hypothetical protein